MPSDEDKNLEKLYEFGPFRVDPGREVLLRAGEPVPLTPKTFQVLLVLVRHHKEIVSKDDLMKAVWPDTFVEEANLSRNIFMLRKALGDNLEDHRYIITVPGRGYRFAENVRLAPATEVSIVAAQHSKVEVRVKETKFWEWLSVIAVGLLGVVGGATWLSLHRKPLLTEKDTVVLADFANSTGDPVFDDTLRQGLAVELQQSPLLSLISDTKIRQTLALMGKPKDARLTPEIALQICERTASAAILEGSISSLGSKYVLGLRARNCNTGTILDQEQIQAATREDVLNSLSQIASKFRTKVGESLATVEKHSTPLAEATTPSLEALKAYSTALKVDVSAGSQASIPFFRRAVEIDPQFAMAYANLGLAYSDVGESVLSVESTSKAWQLRDRASDRERFFIDFTYDREVTGNLEKAYQTLELWLQTYPHGEQPSPHDLLGGLSTHGTGRFERAIEVSREKIAADPDFIFSYGNLASSYFFLDRFPEVESTLERASERKLENPYFLVLRYNLAVLMGDKDQMDRAVTLAKGKPGAEHWMTNAEALALARSGRLQAARQLSTRAVDLALQEGQREKAASYRAARAVWEAVFGNAAEGRKNAMAALELSKGRDIEYAAGFALALSGDSSRSEALAGDLEKRFPEDTFVKFTYAPVLHALSALEHGKPADSVERLQIALPYELAANGLNFNHLYLGGLHSAYVRGEAFIATHRYAEAAAEFQKILDHRGVVSLDPIGALAHLQLARAYASSGDSIKAESQYEDFLALWKDGDPDVPILKQARAEYSKLHQPLVHNGSQPASRNNVLVNCCNQALAQVCAVRSPPGGRGFECNRDVAPTIVEQSSIFRLAKQQLLLADP